MKINKKGAAGEQTMFVSWLFFLVLVSLGLSAGVLIFFGEGIDSRNLESELLLYRVESCLLNNEFPLDEIGSDKFFEECSLNFEILDEHHTLRIVEKNAGELVDFGNSEGCLIEAGEGEKGFPNCVRKGFTDEDLEYDIIAGTRQNVRRSLNE